MNPITIPNISISTIGLPTIGIPSVGFPSASGGGGLVWPVGMKEHIKAWYDPKKQGMTNFDVIESYAEDFTASKWVTVQDRAVFTKTASKIHITESMSDGFNTTFIETRQSRYGNEMKINVSGIVAGGVTLKYRYGSYEEVVDITSNGVYTLPAGKAGTNPNGYNGFVMKAKGKCDITITQLPTSILKDFSGNGNHAYLYGGKGKLNSGMGVYQTDFTTWRKTNFDVHPEYIIATNGNNNLTLYGVKINSINIEIKGYNDKVKFLRLGYNNNDGVYKELNIFNDGIYTIPGSSLGQEGRLCFISLSLKEDTKITITQIPDYPDQLCYDGKMYAVCYGFPILTDYTVMAERTILDNSDIADWAFIAKRDYPAINGAFTFEKDIDDTSDNLRTISFGRTSVIYKPIKERSISYQTKNKYNGQDIIVGNVDDVDFLLIGAGILDTNLNLVKEKMRVAHGAIIIADRSFTEEEINWLKQNWDKI